MHDKFTGDAVVAKDIDDKLFVYVKSGAKIIALEAFLSQYDIPSLQWKNNDGTVRPLQAGDDISSVTVLCDLPLENKDQIVSLVDHPKIEKVTFQVFYKAGVQVKDVDSFSTHECLLEFAAKSATVWARYLRDTGMKTIG